MTQKAEITRGVFICYSLHITKGCFYVNKKHHTATDKAPQQYWTFQNMTFLSGARTSRRHLEKHFPLVKKIISDIF